MTKEFRFVGPLTTEALDTIKKHYSGCGVLKYWRGTTNYEYAIIQGRIHVVRDSQLADRPHVRTGKMITVSLDEVTHLPVIRLGKIEAFLEGNSLEEEVRNLERKYRVELTIQPKPAKPGDVINANGSEYMVVGDVDYLRLMNTQTNELVHGMHFLKEAKFTAHKIVNMLKGQP